MLILTFKINEGFKVLYNKDGKRVESNFLVSERIDENRVVLTRLNEEDSEFEIFPIDDGLSMDESVTVVLDEDTLIMKYIKNNTYNSASSIDLGFYEPNNFGPYNFQIIRDSAKRKYER